MHTLVRVFLSALIASGVATWWLLAPWWSEAVRRYALPAGVVTSIAFVGFLLAMIWSI